MKGESTAHLIRAEVWMSLIHGARGLVYFAHQFQPRFLEASLLEDKELLDAVTVINKQIHELAPVLNSRSSPPASVESENPDVSVAAMLKRHQGATRRCAVATREGWTRATFTLPDALDDAAEVLGESRRILVRGGKFSDDCKGYEVHLYKIKYTRRPAALRIHHGCGGAADPALA